MSALFQHRLMPLRDVLAEHEADGTDPFQWYLTGWYSLSWGWYWLSTQSGDVPTVHPQFARQHHLTGESAVHVDYQVARLWMDLQEILPSVLTPLPEPFSRWVEAGVWLPWIQRVNTWWRSLDAEERRAAPETEDAVWTSQGWWAARHLDMTYLVAPPDIRFWRVDDQVTVDWETHGRVIDGVPAWVESAGQQRYSVEQFESEVTQFRERLDAEMRRHLQDVEALGLLNEHQLESLRRQHEKTLQDVGRPEVPDWKAAQRAVEQVQTLSGIRVEDTRNQQAQP